MGKTRRRMTSPKFAKKYAATRARRGIIEIDLTTGEEITEEETVQVITNKEPEPEAVEEVTIPTPEPQLQTIQIEEPKVNALKQVKIPAAKKATTKKPSPTRKKRPTKKTTSAD